MLAGAVAALATLQGAAVVLAAPASADSVRTTQQWVLDALNVQPAWAITQGKGVEVAVIDSGVDADVSDLVGSVRTGPDLTGVHTSTTNKYWGVHGTWMASLIAGHGHGPDGEDGIIGIAPQSTVLSIRVITDVHDPNFKKYEHEPAAKSQGELATAIRYAVSSGASVISMSLGYSMPSAVVRAALQDAYQHNVFVVASAGNSGNAAGASGKGQAPYSFPADYPGVLAVGAVNQAGQPASFSSENLSVQVAAPGYQVPAQGRDGGYWLVSGTSPACALTAGVAALIKAEYPRLTDEQVSEAITSSTTPGTRPAGRYDDLVGFGEVNAGDAMTAAARLARPAKPAVAMAAAGHFGGGSAAIPAAPVQPRGRQALLLYCVLGLASLTLIAVAVSRLFALRDRQLGRPEIVPEAHYGVRIHATPPGRHAAPRSRAESGSAEPAGPGNGDALQ
jgi:subtilisin family serine protease